MDVHVHEDEGSVGSYDDGTRFQEAGVRGEERKQGEVGEERFTG